jgi:hypothetical protein
MYDLGDFFKRFRWLGRGSWRVTGSMGPSFGGLGSAVADVLLPHRFVGAVADEVTASTRPCDRAIAGGAALRAADPLRRPGAR